MGTLNLAVTEVEHYTDRLFRIKTERPPAFRFSAGEFVMISTLDKDVPSRAYSLTSGPYDNYLEFYSIKVEDGPLTSRLQHIKEGDYIEMGDRATGTLTLANLELGGELWMLATGTGIAPFISLLREPETYEAFDRIHVVWSVRTQEDLWSYNDFLEFPELGDIDYIPIVTQDPDWHGLNKRITTMLADGVILTDADPIKHKVMICGSMPFNNDVKSMLTSWGWQEGNKRTQGTFVQEKAFVG